MGWNDTCAYTNVTSSPVAHIYVRMSALMVLTSPAYALYRPRSSSTFPCSKSRQSGVSPKRGTCVKQNKKKKKSTHVFERKVPVGASAFGAAAALKLLLARGRDTQRCFGSTRPAQERGRLESGAAGERALLWGPARNSPSTHGRGTQARVTLARLYPVVPTQWCSGPTPSRHPTP